MRNGVVVTLEGFNDPLDVTDMMIGKDDITFIDQSDPDLQMDQTSMEDAFSNAYKVKRVINVPSTEEGFFNVSCEAITAMINGSNEDMILVNDTRNGIDYRDTVQGRHLFKRLGKYVTIVDNIHEAKDLL